MKDRIKAIRKETGLTQTQFAESIGLSRIYITQCETGVINPSSRAIRDICRLYRINEEWLLNGTGEMHPVLSRNQQIAEFVNDAMEGADDDIRKIILQAATNLDEEDWKAITRIIRKLKE